MSYIIHFVGYILKHSSGLDTIEYLSHVRHQNINKDDKKTKTRDFISF